MSRLDSSSTAQHLPVLSGRCWRLGFHVFSQYSPGAILNIRFSGAAAFINKDF